MLEINPSHLDARALLAAIAYVRDDRPAFDAEVKRVLAINPAYGEVYRVAGDLAARNYRFDEAVALTGEAMALDPANIRALRRSRHAPDAHRRRSRGARARSSARSTPIRFDQVTYNLLALLDKLDKFVDDPGRRPHLQVRIPTRRAVMREYAMPLAHEALKTLSAKYKFTPKGPILDRDLPEARRLRGAHPRAARA